VNVATPPFDAATILLFKVGYLVESFLPLGDYSSDLEKAILGSALAGALQCAQGNRNPLFGPDGNPSPVPMNTSITDGLCFPESLLNDCLVLETTFRVVIAEDVDPEVARFLGYVQLQEDMADQTVFLDAFPELDRIEYVSPLPLLPPFSTPQDDGQSPDLQASNSTLSVTPWTVGAVLAMCKYRLVRSTSQSTFTPSHYLLLSVAGVGGIVALWVWGRNRRTRNRRHMHLLEESSLISNA
jgi:hypothetical protein